ncbi:MAG TPA: hypothetical protein VEW48_22845 [Thermoanaerobaculia bacterium]|nr:hypothetical protein [Thermoanaerobaculia bacterium]
MRQEMSVWKLLTELEVCVKHHESQEAHHAEREVYHREQRAARASIRVSNLAARVMETKDPTETFGGASIAREINQRYGKHLRRPVQVRNVATALRRMAAAGRIRQVEEGRAYHEALYTR